MSPFQDQTEAFIVRIWVEPRELPHAPPLWRGVVEHVYSGERRYIRSLQDVVEFIAAYLVELGIDPTTAAAPARGEDDPGRQGH